jgi:alginate O-acetyltransferase complex protein AlgI
MIFFSYQFAAATAFFFALYWATPWPTGRRILILAASLAFQFYFAGPSGIMPILILAAGTYIIGRSRDPHLCAGWIVVCVAALVFYKYTHFLMKDAISYFSPALGQLGDKKVSEILPALPPLGISFFVFEFVHYLMEIRHGGRPLRSPLHFAMFATFWPSLVAGPIKRYRQFTVSSSRAVRDVGIDDVIQGTTRIAIGIIKKFTGDVLTGWIAWKQVAFDHFDQETRWLILAAIGMRILLDFSGYSDMAIGFARMMGIRLPENFNWPYLATDIVEFWHRWHISLSTWIRDYLYIPLGGSRHGLPRKVLNAFIAMALCGLWHGASWNFVIWGIYHGLGLVIANAVPSTKVLMVGTRLTKAHPKIVMAFETTWKAASWMMTLLFVNVGWLLFFYPVDKAIRMTAQLFGFLP